MAVDRCLDERLVDHDRADGPQVYAGKSSFGLGGDRSREFGDLADGIQQALLGQFDRHVDDADIALSAQNAAFDTRVGERDVTDSRPGFGPGKILWVDEVAHVQVVAVGGRVLEIRERVDAPGIRCLPGGFGEPDGGRECVLRRGVAIVRNDQERDVLVLAIGIFQRFQSQKLRIVFVEEDAVVGGEIEPGNAARRERNQQERRHDDQPTGREHPFGESRGDWLFSWPVLVHETAPTVRECGRPLDRVPASE